MEGLYYLRGYLTKLIKKLDRELKEETLTEQERDITESRRRAYRTVLVEVDYLIDKYE